MKKREKIEKALEFNPSKAKKKIVEFIERKVEEAGSEGIVLGLSGGLDSATTAYLSVEAVGKDKVLAVFMPEEEVTSQKNTEDSERVAKDLGINLETVQISSIIEKMKDEIGIYWEGKVALANMKARVRMTIIYYFANLLDYLVIGTSNKSEMRCGYFTKYGDGASDLIPMGSLYKTQVKELAEELGVPQTIIEKPPTAGLWKEQTDKKELGLSYEKIDKLYTGLDLGFNEREIAEAIDIEESKIQEFKTREKNSKHKLQRPPMPEL